ncbi:MAG: RNA methyltransferase, partial [Acidimicrobiales bacterium]|nr:RNA methyltransferase [Acidimicrobiales bacterium]
EGALAIERLLAVGGWSIRTVAVTPRLAERLAPLLDEAGAAVVVASRDELAQVVGFDLHRGALASVDRKPLPTPAEVLDGDGRLTVVAEGVNDHENLGALFRNAAAFGASAVLLDPTCADPFYRRSIRVSLGHVLAVPLTVTGPLPEGLADLHDAGIETVALTPGAEEEVRDLAPRLAGRRVALVVGAEGPGLTAPTIAACTHRARIAMAPGVDSLNVATSLAVAAHAIG